MAFQWDFDTATLLAFVAQIVTLIVFMVRTANTAKSAHTRAEAAMKRADDAHDRIAVQHGLHSLLREEVARDYVDKRLLRETETRFTNAIDRLSDRIDEVLDRAKDR